MSILHKLACMNGRRDEILNQELARAIVETDDQQAVQELVNLLGVEPRDIHSDIPRDIIGQIPNDCIKVLYEIGEGKPRLIAPYYAVFFTLLQHKNNRMVWGAMTALDQMTVEEPDAVYSYLAVILDIAASGSVITRDHAVGILIKLASIMRYSDECIRYLFHQLQSCPANQFPMYVEQSETAMQTGNREAFMALLRQRIVTLEKESQKKRIEKVIKRLSR